MNLQKLTLLNLIVNKPPNGNNATSSQNERGFEKNKATQYTTLNKQALRLD